MFRETKSRPAATFTADALEAFWHIMLLCTVDSPYPKTTMEDIHANTCHPWSVT